MGSLCSGNVLLKKRERATTSQCHQVLFLFCFFFLSKLTTHCCSISPESCRFDFFSKVLNTVGTGNAGLAVRISSRQLCRADGDHFVPVRWEGRLLTCCTPSLWGGSTDVRSVSADWCGLPSPLCLLFLCWVVRKKIGAVLTPFAHEVCSWRGLTFMQVEEIPRATTTDRCLSAGGCRVESESTVTASAALGCSLLGHRASLQTLLRLSLLSIVKNFKFKDFPEAIRLWRSAVTHDASGNVRLCDVSLSKKASVLRHVWHRASELANWVCFS